MLKYVFAVITIFSMICVAMGKGTDQELVQQQQQEADALMSCQVDDAELQEYYKNRKLWEACNCNPNPCCCAKIVKEANRTLQGILGAIADQNVELALTYYTDPLIFSAGPAGTPFLTTKAQLGQLFTERFSTVRLVGNYGDINFHAYCPDQVLAYGFPSFTVFPKDGSPSFELNVQTVISFTRNYNYCPRDPLSRKFLIAQEWVLFVPAP